MPIIKNQKFSKEFSFSLLLQKTYEPSARVLISLCHRCQQDRPTTSFVAPVSDCDEKGKDPTILDRAWCGATCCDVGAWVRLLRLLVLLLVVRVSKTLG
ncbi:hypothetical protein ES288_1Z040200v1 [Gossypium darwinii]|uniref:Uncharacterized protein n=1 Tax=Gossypium darwinii TaxID=34276 RepID=A0A5C7J099_GOSDA|nr:hypothetical protein ES288_1Z040200v1 [Gossypium darwinii]